MTGTSKTTKSTAKTAAKTPAKRAASADASYDGFTAEERAAMKEHAQEMKASSRRRGSAAEKAAEAEAAVVAKIAEMADADRVMAERIHAIVKKSAPGLAPKLWYGMPAYAKDGKVLCFFQSAEKFNARYATFGFNDVAALDDGAMWPTAFAITELTAADERRIADLVKTAAG
ncbi:iron chaperone [Yinghuangia sp. YIM S09857]|uniref:iron chaperone n=1 Tax=Yinghuangia sp. YIM S09857 TaxID=3436929 RepID=UPI003F530842